ncbi:transmembrane protein 184C-like [Acanthaster planci]|uniref:Transmembrane protein 184C-like n=1 Tax=Acanthaster planci TaxID=133434 RepID=A0A8B7XZW0_ACAPL|nr:transmembrane protein 184C-like [Acanthaster planci]
MEIDRDPSSVEQGQSTPTPLVQGDSSPRSCWANWRRWVRPAFYVAYALLVIATIPLIILDLVHAKKQNIQVTLAAVGFFAMVICIPISLWGIINHIVCYTRPDLQKYIIRILWIVPIYEVNCWFALRFPAAEIYLDTLRQLYQAYVIYNYVFYLLTFFEEVPNFKERLLAKPLIKSPAPCCCVKAVPNQRIINRCRNGVLNYTVIRIIFSGISLVTDLLGKFEEGNYSPNFAYLWVTICVTISQIWAIFCMVLLRKATLQELEMLPRSTAQFVGIQMVIFVSNFQSVILNLLAQFGVFERFEDPFAFATMLQDFLICLEMVLGAAVFSYSFDYQRYNTDSEHKMILSKSFKHMLNVSDVKNNIMDHLRFGGHTFQRNHSEAAAWAEQLSPSTPDSPTSIQDFFPPRDAVLRPRIKTSRKQKLTCQPDIVLNQQGRPDSPVDEMHTPDEQSGRKKQDGALQNRGFEYPEDQQVLDPQEDDVSGDMDDLIGEEFPVDDDDSDEDSHLPVDARLDKPPAAPHHRRVKKVSFSGMNFDDMDVDHIKNHRSPTMDSDSFVTKETEKGTTEGSEGFGSSEA